MNFRTDTPIHGIHEELFDLFIMEFAVVRDGDSPLNRSRSEFELNKKAWVHGVLKDLFPMENEPEGYECVVLDREIQNEVVTVLKIEHEFKQYPFLYPKEKIKITVEQE